MTNPIDTFREFKRVIETIGPKIVLATAMQYRMCDNKGNFIPKTDYDLIIVDYIDRLSPPEKQKIIDEKFKNS